MNTEQGGWNTNGYPLHREEKSVENNEVVSKCLEVKGMRLDSFEALK